MSRTHVFVGCSVDGFIAGPDNELDWLSGSPQTEGELPDTPDTFGPFFAQIGAVLMGRHTYDVLLGFPEGQWQYGDTPLLVATHRPLPPVLHSSVRPVHGSIHELVEQAKQVAGERDVYVDGGELIRSALDAGLVDEITVTIVPVVLGAGIPLFAGATRRHFLELVSERRVGGAAVELRYRTRK